MLDRKTSWLTRRMRRLWYLYGPTYRQCCLKCGFLSFEGKETPEGARRIVAAEGADGWFISKDAISCHKGLWDWDVGSAPIDVIVSQANRPRFSCVGFHRYVPGRSPQEHLKLEDNRLEFRRKIVLQLLPFIGALLGALIGAYFGKGKEGH